MSTYTVITGHLAEEPDTGVSQQGVSWTRMVVITNDRYRDQNDAWIDGPAVRYRVTLFRRSAENAANTLHTGDLVLAAGTLTTRGYRDADGNPRSSRDMIADHVGVALDHATVVITRNPRSTATDIDVAAPVPADF